MGSGDQMQITWEMLLEMRTKRGQFNKTVLGYLGVFEPVPNFDVWANKLIGQEIDSATMLDILKMNEIADAEDDRKERWRRENQRKWNLRTNQNRFKRILPVKSRIVSVEQEWKDWESRINRQEFGSGRKGKCESCGTQTILRNGFCKACRAIARKCGAERGREHEYIKSEMEAERNRGQK